VARGAQARVKPRDIADLVLLAALWGASFLFMRVAAPHFGAVPTAALRVGGAALLLLPLLASRAGLDGLRRHWQPIALIGVTNSALPFLCFSLAALSISAGLSSILNATSPMFGALIAMAWLREPSNASRLAGLAVGFAGVALLAWNSNAPLARTHGSGAGLAIGLCLAASLLYGFSASFARRYLAGVEPLAVATGSQVSAALVLALPAMACWPTTRPALPQWLAVLALALFCTGIAYVLYFRLIARIGPAKAIAVTYLVPPFAMLWAGVFLGEAVTPGMLALCALILLGTSLATGMLRLPFVARSTRQNGDRPEGTSPFKR
jgi:drug/metabolite transporter (DMT)-like permease